MNQLLKSKCTILPLCMILVFLPGITSCDNEWPDDLCDCEGGNTIGGWEDANDTTIVNKNDSIGGFAISMDEWGSVCTQDIPL